MTERLLFAAVILVAIAAAGFVVRAVVSSRSARLATTATMQPAAAATVRMMLFSSTGCGACVTQRRLIEEQRDSWQQPVEISYHDAVEESELARRFGIMIVPALVVASSDGRVVGVKQGLADKDRLRSLIAAAA